MTMTLTLELAPDVQAALDADAMQNGRSREELVTEALRQAYGLTRQTTESAINSGNSGQTAAEAFAGRVGRFHSGGKRGKKSFADHLADKREADLL